MPYAASSPFPPKKVENSKVLRSCDSRNTTASVEPPPKAGLGELTWGKLSAPVTLATQGLSSASTLTSPRNTSP